MMEVPPYVPPHEQASVSAGTFADELQFLETRTERCMVDADNLLFQAGKMINNGQTVPLNFFTDLNQQVSHIKRDSAEMSRRLDMLGIQCGGAQ